MADQLVCNSNGEVEVEDILAAINELLTKCEEVSECCEIHSVGDVIRIHKDGNQMWMTNDGSDPTPVP